MSKLVGDRPLFWASRTQKNRGLSPDSRPDSPDSSRIHFPCTLLLDATSLSLSRLPQLPCGRGSEPNSVLSCHPGAYDLYLRRAATIGEQSPHVPRGPQSAEGPNHRS